ncbi:MAG: hypothetical protein ACLR7U_06445 [Ruthenibacterium lactatiformans]
MDNLLADALRAALPEARAAQEVRALTAAGPPHAQRRQTQHALAVLVQAAAPGAEDKEPVAVRAKRIIDENFADPMMGLYLVSEQLNVSNSYLSTTFKATYGVSIIRINRFGDLAEPDPEHRYEHRTSPRPWLFQRHQLHPGVQKAGEPHPPRSAESRP